MAAMLASFEFLGRDVDDGGIMKSAYAYGLRWQRHAPV